jgi:hypothetical protein
MMESRLQYPQWQETLATAVVELNPQRLLEKLQKAEEIIHQRVRELTNDTAEENELRALYDGLSLIRIVRKEVKPN